MRGPVGSVLQPQWAEAHDIDAGGTPAEIAAGATLVDLTRAALDVKRYGAKGDGVTDDRAAIKTAWLVAKKQGGGTIKFPDGGTYMVASLDPASPISLPQQQSDGSITYANYQTALYFQNGSNIEFDFGGSTLTTSITGGGAFLVLDGCTDILFVKPKLTGTQVQSSGFVAAGAITPGAGYTPGTYTGVPMTGGSGGGAICTVTVGAGGGVTAVVPTYPGGNYIVGDSLSASAANLGGPGGGFSVLIASVSGAGPVVAVAAPNGVVITALSQPSTKITVQDLNSDRMFTGLYVVADPTTANTVTHLSVIGSTRVSNGEYGVAIHNCGDNSVVQNLYAYRVNRPWFIYGVENLQIKAVGEQIALGFQPVIKAYSRSTRNVTWDYALINTPGKSTTAASVSIQVQCDPAVVNPPPVVREIYATYSEDNAGSGGYGIELDYFAGAGGTVQTATSSAQLFQNISIRGRSANLLRTTVQLTTPANFCTIDYSGLQCPQPAAANAVSVANGFMRPQLIAGGVHVDTGAGAPTASWSDGSTWLQTDAGAGSPLWIRQNGAWTNVTLP